MKSKKFNPQKESKWKLSHPRFIKKTDDRYPKAMKQLKKRGFAWDETWALYEVISEFTLPRLIAFRELKIGTPTHLFTEAYFSETATKREKAKMTRNANMQWVKILDDMIAAFQIIVEKGSANEEEQKILDHGLDLFRQNFLSLWW